MPRPAPRVPVVPVFRPRKATCADARLSDVFTDTLRSSQSISLHFQGITTLDTSSAYSNGPDDAARRVHTLLLSHNRLRSLEGIQVWSNVQHVSLAFNENLYDWEELGKLAPGNIRTLSLQGCAISRRPNFRFACLKRFPKLEVLNGEPVTERDRRDLIPASSLGLRYVQYIVCQAGAIEALQAQQVLRRKRERGHDTHPDISGFLSSDDDEDGDDDDHGDDHGDDDDYDDSRGRRHSNGSDQAASLLPSLSAWSTAPLDWASDEDVAMDHFGRFFSSFPLPDDIALLVNHRRVIARARAWFVERGMHEIASTSPDDPDYLPFWPMHQAFLNHAMDLLLLHHAEINALRCGRPGLEPPQRTQLCMPRPRKPEWQPSRGDFDALMLQYRCALASYACVSEALDEMQAKVHASEWNAMAPDISVESVPGVRTVPRSGRRRTAAEKLVLKRRFDAILQRKREHRLRLCLWHWRLQTVRSVAAAAPARQRADALCLELGVSGKAHRPAQTQGYQQQQQGSVYDRHLQASWGVPVNQAHRRGSRRRDPRHSGIGGAGPPLSAVDTSGTKDTDVDVKAGASATLATASTISTTTAAPDAATTPTPAAITPAATTPAAAETNVVVDDADFEARLTAEAVAAMETQVKTDELPDLVDVTSDVPGADIQEDSFFDGDHDPDAGKQDDAWDPHAWLKRSSSPPTHRDLPPDAGTAVADHAAMEPAVTAAYDAFDSGVAVPAAGVAPVMSEYGSMVIGGQLSPRHAAAATATATAVPPPASPSKRHNTVNRRSAFELDRRALAASQRIAAAVAPDPPPAAASDPSAKPSPARAPLVDSKRAARAPVPYKPPGVAE